MSIEIKVPQLPESVADATLVSWHRKAGEPVKRDENLVDLETDKVVLEVPAPSDGVLKEIKVSDGATVTSGQVLAVLEPGEAASAGGDGSAAAKAEPAARAERAGQGQPATKADKPEKDQKADRPEKDQKDQKADKPEKDQKADRPERDKKADKLEKPTAVETADSPSEAEGDVAGETMRMGPAARKLIEEHDLDVGAIAGSGREGRVTKGDVLDYLATRRDSGLELDREDRAPERPLPAGERAEQRVPMTRLRARIAERLVEAQQTAAMLTTFNEVDMSAVMALRKRYGEAFQGRYEIKLGFMSFFVKACIEALRRFPLLNASVDGKEIVYHEYFDVGVAVSTDRGLVVPVLRDAEHMSAAQIERAIADFGRRARNGEITIEELTGGTFTITNGGIFGSLMSTPILNPPQSGILGMHKIEQRPVVADGEIVVRPMMYLALTYDHRIVDGREAVQFLVAVKDQLEDPARLLLQI